MKKKKLGKLGEKLAVKHLRNNGYQILQRNFFSKFGEIDIICLESNCLVFVEVKTRWGKNFGRPEEAVTERKISHIKKVGLYYKMVHPRTPEAFRIDVVAVSFSSQKEVEEIRIFKNITR